MIQIKGLEKIYVSGAGELAALKGIDLTVEDGSAMGIIGLSGAGKSTLIRCINLLETPTRGSILIDGEDLTGAGGRRLREIRRNLGMIFQNFNLLEQRNLLGNVTFPLEIAGWKKEKARERAREMLSLVGLEGREKDYPSMLSGGQKQRVAIARALAPSPRYLLCDEATSALDPATTGSLLALLKRINRELGVTLIVVTHEMKVVESICSHVAVIDGGVIAETGRVSEVFAFPKSEIARRLILPSLREGTGTGTLRLIFRGESPDAPVISALAIERGIAVNILFAETRIIEGKLFGHMIVSLPGDPEQRIQAKELLRMKGVAFEEESA